MYAYYYMNGKEQVGPVSESQLSKVGIDKTTLVWRNGLTQWVKAGELDELRHLFEAASPLPEAPEMPESTDKEVEEIDLTQMDFGTNFGGNNICDDVTPFEVNYEQIEDPAAKAREEAERLAQQEAQRLAEQQAQQEAQRLAQQQQQQQPTETSDNDDIPIYDEMPQENNGSNGCIWLFVGLVITAVIIGGIYTFIQSNNRSSYHNWEDEYADSCDTTDYYYETPVAVDSVAWDEAPAADLSVSSTYLEIPYEGGTFYVQVYCDDYWSITTPTADWIKTYEYNDYVELEIEKNLEAPKDDYFVITSSGGSSVRINIHQY